MWVTLRPPCIETVGKNLFEKIEAHAPEGPVRW